MIDYFSVICQTYKDYAIGDIEAKPWENNVIFGSARYKWGFTINTFADMYSSRFGLSTAKMCRKLWHSCNHWHSETRKWNKKKVDETCKKGFVQFVLEPIQELHDAILNHGETIYGPMVESLMQTSMIQGDEYEKWLEFPCYDLHKIYTQSYW